MMEDFSWQHEPLSDGDEGGYWRLAAFPLEMVVFSNEGRVSLDLIVDSHTDPVFTGWFPDVPAAMAAAPVVARMFLNRGVRNLENLVFAQIAKYPPYAEMLKEAYQADYSDGNGWMIDMDGGDLVPPKPPACLDGGEAADLDPRWKFKPYPGTDGKRGNWQFRVKGRLLAADIYPFNAVKDGEPSFTLVIYAPLSEGGSSTSVHHTLVEAQRVGYKKLMDHLLSLLQNTAADLAVMISSETEEK